MCMPSRVRVIGSAMILCAGAAPAWCPGAAPLLIQPWDAFPGRAYSAGVGPFGVALGDVDGDGDLDAALALFGSDAVVIMRNQGAGTFVRGATIAAGDGTRAVVLADIDGDNDLDLIAANELGDTLTVSRNNGSGVFTSGTAIAAASGPVALAAGDVDGDADIDLVVAHLAAGVVRIYRNDGAGVFGPDPDLALSAAQCIALEDIDGDGDPEIVAGGWGGIVRVFRNDGVSGFVFDHDIALGESVVSLALGDFDGDGQTDIAAGSPFAGHVFVIERLPGGAFAPPSAHPMPNSVNWLCVGDLDADAHPDIVAVTGEPGAEVIVFRNLGDGSFSPTSYPAGASPQAAAVGDLDGDGDMDVALTELGTDTPTQAGTLAGGMVVLRGDGRGSLLARDDYTVFTNEIRDVALGDVDGDGDADIVVSDPFSGGLEIGACIVLENIDGVFENRQTFGTGGRAAGVRLGDLDGDGDIDVCIANSAYRFLSTPSFEHAGVAVFLNSSAGGFILSQTIAAIGSPESVAIGDMDADGDLDLVAATGRQGVGDLDGGVYLIRNLGGAVFGSPEQQFVSPSASTVALGDFDGDGALDVVFGDAQDQSTRVLMNTGSGTLIPNDALAIGGQVSGLAVGDVNADGTIDIVAVNLSTEQVAVVAGNGDGTFGDPWTRNVGRRPSAVAIGDVDGDGLPDIAVTNKGDHTTSVMLNRGDGTFTVPQVFSTALHPNGTALGDIDGDSDLDVVTAGGAFSGGVSVLKNQRIRRPRTLCPADVDGDAFVTTGDFVVLAGHYGAAVAPGTKGDLNGDGIVSAADFVILAANFGCGP